MQALKFLVSMALIACLAGCDGTVGFRSPAGTVEQSSGRKLIRGLADARQSRNEDPQKSENRRDLIEMAAEKNELRLSEDLGEILESNSSYSNIKFGDAYEGVSGMPAYPVSVDFDIEGGHHVKLLFFVERMTMLKFIHLSRLPMLSEGSVAHGKTGLPIRDVDLFTLLLDKDPSALKNRADKFWSVIKAKNDAAAASAAQLACEKEVRSREGDFEVDPSSSDEEKEATAKQFWSEQESAMKACAANTQATSMSEEQQTSAK